MLMGGGGWVPRPPQHFVASLCRQPLSLPIVLVLVVVLVLHPIPPHSGARSISPHRRWLRACWVAIYFHPLLTLLTLLTFMLTLRLFKILNVYAGQPSI